MGKKTETKSTTKQKSPKTLGDNKDSGTSSPLKKQHKKNTTPLKESKGVKKQNDLSKNKKTKLPKERVKIPLTHCRLIFEDRHRRLIKEVDKKQDFALFGFVEKKTKTMAHVRLMDNQICIVPLKILSKIEQE